MSAPVQTIRLDLQLQALALVAVLAPQLPALALDMRVTALPAELAPPAPLMALLPRQPQTVDAALVPALVGPRGPAGPAGDALPTSPTFTYTDGWLTAVVYADGTTKALSYTAGRLAQVDTLRPGLPTMRKTLSYNPDGTLASLLQTVI
jgi:hypothetical protein